MPVPVLQNFRAMVQYWEDLKDVWKLKSPKFGINCFIKVKALSAWAASVSAAFDHTFLEDSVNPRYL